MNKDVCREAQQEDMRASDALRASGAVYFTCEEVYLLKRIISAAENRTAQETEKIIKEFKGAV